MPIFQKHCHIKRCLNASEAELINSTCVIYTFLSGKLVKASQANNPILKAFRYNMHPHIIWDIEVKPVRLPAHLTLLA